MDSPMLNSPNCMFVITHVRSNIGLQFVISQIWGWKITHVWPTFEPLYS